MIANDSTEILEKAVIGSVLANPYNLNLLPALEADHFTNLKGKATWSAIRNLEARSSPIDMATVSDELGSTGKLDAVGFAYLGECQFDVPTVENAVEYATLLRDKALRMRLLLDLGDVVQAAKDGATGADVLEQLHVMLGQVHSSEEGTGKNIRQVVKDRMLQLEQIAADRMNGVRTMTGYHTGVEKLDKFTGGWQPGIVSIVAARPGMGKSSLGLATADAATTAGSGVHIFSLEDTESAYADRTISRKSGVPAEKLRNSDYAPGDIGQIAQAMSKLGTQKNWILDSRSGVSAQDIVRSVRRDLLANNTKIVIVDYIQLLKRHRGVSTHESLGESMTTLADAAKQDNIAYVVMSQLNREVEKRTDKRPVMADLRESGSLEERSKCIIALYRGAYYGAPQDGIDYDAKREPRPSTSEFERSVQLLILKNNNGQTGSVAAQWFGPTTTIR